MTQYKIGDRVRVTHEGEIQKIDKNGVLFRVGSGRTFTWFDSCNTEAAITIEKLPDPEPEWVNGDVIELLGLESDYVDRFEYHLIDGAWIHYHGGTFGESVSDYWNEGRVRIIHKADAQPVAQVQKEVA